MTSTDLDTYKRKKTQISDEYVSDPNHFFSFQNVIRERKQREVYLESMKKEAEQKKQQAERIDRRAVSPTHVVS